jgi:UDP-GlcNAc:undecaprenyl-phosphate/decaprenyl-phosphate GlcNAc-1-phosphate transferase
LSSVVPLLEVAPLCFAAALIFTPAARRLARITGYLDHPDLRKTHPGPTPLLGGAAVAAAIVAGLLAARVFLGSSLIAPRPGIWVGALLSLVLGLVDDRRSMPPLGKLAGQIVAALCLVYWGTDVEPLRANPLLGAMAVVGVAGLLNAINFLDAMDGIVSAVIPVTAGGFVALALLHGAPVDVALAWALIGACAGFLVSNAPPARIFLGDAGSHLLGFALAALALQSLERSFTSPHVASILLLLAYPLFDLVFVICDRALRRRPIYVGGMDHTSHRLGRVFGQWGTLGVVSLVTVVNTGVAIWLWNAPERRAVIAVVCGMGLGYGLFGFWLRRIGPTPQFDI